ncbi:MAG TPA: glycosyltransferase 87 family protein [Actinomycetota bacterium]|nr:glycosyltransferase 87 family protein [Actinomycetota bacterium]
MAEDARGRPGLLERSPTGLVVALVAVRVLVLAALIAAALRNPVTDVAVLRAQRIASSPATPYRNFPVGTMPLQTLTVRLFEGGSPSTVAIKVALLAFVADLAAAWALAWGWGRRPSTLYLLLGLPLLPVVYLRFELVGVALAVWAVAWIRHRGEVLGGATLGVAVMTKLWPIVLAPLVLLRRARSGAIAFAGVILVLGAWWYLTGGPKGPFQVASFREARGWQAQSLVGNLLWLLGRSPTYVEADALRIGHAAEWMRGLLFLGLAAVEAVLWRRADRQEGDPAAGSALAAVAALTVFSPFFAVQFAAWYLPWTALAYEGDAVDRRTATAGVVVIALTGLIGLLWSDPTATPAGWVAWLVLARNVAAIAVVVIWLRARDRRAVPVRARVAAAAPA